MKDRLRLGLVASVALLWVPPPPPAQDAAGVIATIEPDTVRVGEPFTVRVAVSRARPGQVQFPALMELPEHLEQRGPVQIRSSSEGARWEAEYRLVAWRADTVSIPELEVGFGEAGTRTQRVAPPAVTVASVLPVEADAELELREARPFLRVRGFPWWLLGLVAGLAALWWWVRRSRRRVAMPQTAMGPGGLALHEFERLRRAWIGGSVSGDRFYDEYEATLRRYARATRGWSPAEGLGPLGGSEGSLLSALRHSVLARFARVLMRGDGPLQDLDAGVDFVHSEMPPEPDESQVDGDAGTVEPESDAGPDAGGRSEA